MLTGSIQSTKFTNGDVHGFQEEFQNKGPLVAKCRPFSENTGWLQGKQWVLK